MNKISFFFLLLPLLVRAQVGCVEEKVALVSAFIPSPFDAARTTVGEDQLDPVKTMIQRFVVEHPELLVTDITVAVSSARAPFLHKGKRDPASDEKNLSLAKQRSEFAQKVLFKIQKSSSDFAQINFQTTFELAGPQFEPKDSNLRFVTKETEGYQARVQQLFTDYAEVYKTAALKKSYEELMDSKEYPTLYQAKFKPFQGFRVMITGHHKGKLKCVDKTATPATKPAASTKQ